MFRETQHKFIATQKFLGDKAYIGDDAITTPQKKTKNTEISELQKQDKK
ncbi:transposase family protein [Nostoc sp. 'Peltigera membranacea cyanobiont' 210A]|nr:transposase family protein [Nostoc sp. 'Peltigera membranacea cyanobiont' 210A]